MSLAQRIFRLLVTTVVVLATLTVALASVPAGTRILNRAELSYIADDVPYVLASNEVEIEVSAVRSFSLTADQTASATPSSRVVFRHELTNTGNTELQFTLSVRNTSAPAAFESLKLYIDTDNNGVIDVTDVEVGAGSTFALTQIERLYLLVEAVVASSAQAGTSHGIVVEAVSGGVAATNTDTITVAGSDVRISKTASVANAARGDTVVFTISAANDGMAVARPVAVTVDGGSREFVLVRDRVPANTTLAAVENAGTAEVLYHLASEADPDVFTAARPGDSALIDAVVLALPSLDSGATFTTQLSFTVGSNASGEVRNVAAIEFIDGQRRRREAIATVRLPDFGPEIAFFTSDFTRKVTVEKAGSALHVQGTAAACNVDPLVPEQRAIRLQTSRSLDEETFVASETGPNTGRFRIVPSVATRTADAVKGNAAIEVAPNDKVTAEVECGGKTATSALYVDPAGVVFDSRSNEPVSGATVTLVDVDGHGNGGKPGQPAAVFAADGITPAPSTVKTTADGKFQFPSVAPSRYQLLVTPKNGYTVPSAVVPSQLPAGRNIDPAGSYLGVFTVDAATGTVLIDVPADAGALSGLFVQKRGSKQYASLGDFVDFTVEVKNGTGRSLDDVLVKDVMPRGFRYVRDSARVDGSSIAEPRKDAGAHTFSLGTLVAGQTVKLTYRVEIGPGIREGRVFNLAQAISGATLSNEARAPLVVEGGGFSQLGFIVGNVYTRCLDATGRIRNFGVAGAKVFLEDGTYAVTDAAGKYSLYGVRAQTHVLKIDAVSLPRGSQLIPTSSRNGEDGNSHFVDMKYGELRRADFALDCSDSVREYVERQADTRDGTELASSMKGTFNPTVQTEAVLQTPIASGELNNNSLPRANADAVTPSPASGSATTVHPRVFEAEPVGAKEHGGDSAVSDAALGFVNLRDGEVLAAPQINLVVKGPSGSTFKLLVNGAIIPHAKVGEKRQFASVGADVWRFIGVDFKSGKNTVAVSAEDAFGNERTAAVTVIVPDQVALLKVTVPSKPVQADGYSTAKIKIELLDKSGQKVAGGAQVSLEADGGRWLARDYDDKTPGVQTFVANGSATLDFLAPDVPGDVRLRVSSNGAVATQVLSFVPELRPMTAAGIIDYQIRFDRKNTTAIQPVTGFEGFEESLRLFSSSAGSTSFGSRTAMYLKGKILGSNLLTMAYDSNRQSGECLFRDIQPDRFYPVYGDSSTRGFDAQSTSKLYLRIDNGRSYLVYGDFLTSDSADTSRVLTNYSRSMTGVRHRYDSDRTTVSSFASYDSSRQVTQEFAANGTSGPFTFTYQNGIENSEKVEVLVRDRNQPAVVLSRKLLARFDDYEFEPFTGRLLLKAPLPTLDENLNPVSLRVTYEMEQGGERYWTTGVDGEYAVNKHLSVGGIAVADANPEDPNQMLGLRTSINTFGGGVLSAEVATTSHDHSTAGTGYRAEYRQEGKSFRANLYFGRTTEGFQNQSSLLAQGRGEAGAKFAYAISNRTRLDGEFLRTEDTQTDGTLVGANVGVERDLTNDLRLRLNLRHAQQTVIPAGGQFMNAGAPSVGDTELTTIGAKLTATLRRLRKTEVSAGFEQDVTDASKHRLAVGASTPLGPKGKLYARHEFLSSLGDVYGLNGLQSRMATVVGVETDYLKKTQLFSEFRKRDELVMRDVEAAIGLRNAWSIRKDLSVNGSFEHIHSFGEKAGEQGIGVGSSIAITAGVDYAADNTLRIASKLELRNSASSNSYLASFAVGRQLTNQWTVLSRNVLLREVGKVAQSGERTQARFQTGVAYRGSELSRWDMLSMFEYRIQDGSGSAMVLNQRLALFSTNINYQPVAGFAATGRYSTKWLLDRSSDLRSQSFNQMFSWRVTRDIGRRFDVGLMGSTLANSNFTSREQALGAEFGVRVMQNLWFSSGYNMFGFNESELPGGKESRRGAFLRLRFKFDENVLKGPIARRLVGGDERVQQPQSEVRR